MARKVLTRLLTRLVRRIPIRPATKASRARQSPAGSEGVRPIQLVIGLDFGTSFSKVVVGETRVRYAVPFEAYSVGDNPFLLPSCLRVLNREGECTLGINGQDGVLHDNLKMPLIEGDFSDEVRARAAAFLALVLRHTRDWLFKFMEQTTGTGRLNGLSMLDCPPTVTMPKSLMQFTWTSSDQHGSRAFFQGP